MSDVLKISNAAANSVFKTAENAVGIAEHGVGTAKQITRATENLGKLTNTSVEGTDKLLKTTFTGIDEQANHIKNITSSALIHTNELIKYISSASNIISDSTIKMVDFASSIVNALITIIRYPFDKIQSKMDNIKINNDKIDTILKAKL